MNLVDCTCNGKNLSCSKCDGRGYYDLEEKPMSPIFISTQEKEIISKNLVITSIDELRNNFKSIVDNIERCSSTQQIAIENLTKFKWKPTRSKIEISKIKLLFEELDRMESKKFLLKNELSSIIKIGLEYKIYFKPDYIHPLSTKQCRIKSFLDARNMLKNIKSKK